MKVNYIHHLSCFFFRLERTKNMRPPHFSLYMALFRLWNNLKFPDKMTVSRLNLMHVSKIGSKDCYYKCMKELQEAKFIEYVPGGNTNEQAQVSMKRLDLIQPDPGHPEETGTGSDDVLSQNQSDAVPESVPFKKGIETENKINSPAYADVVHYFQEKGHAEREAQKFFNYYESIGWLQGPSKPIVNWKAAVCNWVLNKRPEKYRKRKDDLDAPKKPNYEKPL